MISPHRATTAGLGPLPAPATAQSEALATLEHALADWLERENARVVPTIKARPVDLIEHDLSRMLTVPPVPPQLGWLEHIRLGRDYDVRLDASDYSSVVDTPVVHLEKMRRYLGEPR